MAREDEKQLRYKEQRSKEAIDMAMQARWQEAVEINKEISPAFRKMSMPTIAWAGLIWSWDNIKLSREAYQKAVELDPYNAIANRNLRRLNDLKDAGKTEIETDKVEPQQFIEEIGKAGVVTLEELAQKEKRASYRRR